MKKGLVVAISVVAIVIIVVAVALRANHKSYVNVIPASAVAVAYVDLPEIVEESGVEPAVLDTIFGEEFRLQDVGLDFTEKAYIFVSKEGIPGLLFSVDDAGKLHAFLNRMQEVGRCSLPESYRGYEWANLSDSYLVGYNSEACLIMGPSLAAAQSELRQLMLSYFDQPKVERAVNDPMFKRLKEQEGLVALIGKMELVPSFYSLFHAAGLSFDAATDDFLLTATLNTDENKLRFHAEVESADKKFEKQLKQMLSMFGHIDGDLLTVIPEDVYAWCGIHADGDELIKELRKNNTFLLFLMMANQVFDLESLIKNIDGDCSCFPLGTDFQSFVLACEVRDNQILKDASAWVERSNPDMSMKWNDSIFSVKTTSFESKFGMLDDEHMFVATGVPGQVQVDQTKWNSNRLKPFEDEIEGSLIYLWLDVQKALQADKTWMESFGTLFDPSIPEKGLAGLDVITLRMENVNNLDLTLIFEKGKSPVRQIMGN